MQNKARQNSLQLYLAWSSLVAAIYPYSLSDGCCRVTCYCKHVHNRDAHPGRKQTVNDISYPTAQVYSAFTSSKDRERVQKIVCYLTRSPKVPSSDLHNGPSHRLGT
jgi:hypothetical protein